MTTLDEAELIRVATQNGMFPNGHAVNRPLDGGRKFTVIAYGHNGRPMLVNKGMSRTGKNLTVERWNRRSDIARIDVKEIG